MVKVNLEEAEGKSVKIARFRDLMQDAREKSKRLTTYINWIVAARLFSFLSVMILGWFALQNQKPVLWIPDIFLGVVFLYFVRYHQQLLYRKKIQLEMISFYTGEIKSLQGDFSAFEDGATYADPAHPYVADLDIFGEGSLFQFLNRTTTFSGKQKLAEKLKSTGRSPKIILETQEAIKELAEKTVWRALFFATGRVMKEEKNDENQLKKSITSIPFSSHFTGLRGIAILLSITLITLVILNIARVIPFQVVLLAFIIPASIEGVFLKRINRFHATLSEGIRILRKYEKLLMLIEDEPFHSRIMTQMGEELGMGEVSTKTIFKKLLRAFESLDARSNIFVGIFLNLLLLWDIQCIWAVWQWNKRYGDKIETWFEILAETDALNAFASFADRFQEYSWPLPSLEDELVKAEKMGHPLLDPGIRVDNDFCLDQPGKFYILTGPNMAGKSTFLRALGTNIILAECGAPVCARHFIFRPHILYTSMRTFDSLRENTSYFYAELKRLQEIISVMKTRQPVLVLLDEILKGTNSEDKSSGSKAVIRKMIHYCGSGIIATHDLSLGTLERELPDHIVNICFEAYREDEQLRFDYLLRKGITRNMNATFLMQKMGIIDENNRNPLSK